MWRNEGIHVQVENDAVVALTLKQKGTLDAHYTSCQEINPGLQILYWFVM